jgi:hypothetical protein
MSPGRGGRFAAVACLALTAVVAACGSPDSARRGAGEAAAVSIRRCLRESVDALNRREFRAFVMAYAPSARPYLAVTILLDATIEGTGFSCTSSSGLLWQRLEAAYAIRREEVREWMGKSHYRYGSPMGRDNELIRPFAERLAGLDAVGIAAEALAGVYSCAEEAGKHSIWMDFAEHAKGEIMLTPDRREAQVGEGRGAIRLVREGAAWMLDVKQEGPSEGGEGGAGPK